MRFLNRCMETVSAPSGSGSFAISSSAGWHTVAGYAGQYQTFAATSGVTTNDTFIYCAYDSSNNTEIGLGTYATGVLARTLIFESTNGNSPCSFSGTVTLFNGTPDIWFLPGYAVAAAGTTQGTATPLTQRVSMITSGSANQGVILNSYLPEQIIFNATGVIINIYPSSGANINALAANTAATLYAGNGVTIRQISLTQWNTM